MTALVVEAPSAIRPAARALAPVVWVLRWTLSATAVLAAWLVLFAFVLSGLQEHRTQRTLYAKFRQELAEATAPVSEPVDRGAPVALLSVPRLGLSRAVVVQGTTSRQLVDGPGHEPGSVLPGQAGTSVLLGRAVSFGGPFGSLPRLRVGDPVDVVTGQGLFEYHVERIRHAGDSVVPPAAGTGRLTLVTSEADGWRSGWAPSHTVLVDAGLAHPAQAGAVASQSRADVPMRGDSGSLVPLVFWLEALLAVSLVLVWSVRRWGAAHSWIVGGVGVVAVLWGASQSAWTLLPNLL